MHIVERCSLPMPGELPASVLVMSIALALVMYAPLY